MKKLTVAALALAFAVPASASVLCQKRSGAVFFRSSCKRSEADVTGSVLSLLDTDGPGPKGDKGDTGDPGPFPATLPSGKTLTGLYRADTYVNNGGGEVSVFVSPGIGFTYPLAAPPTPNVVPIGGPPTAACPGSAANPQATPGNLCLYAAQGGIPTCVYEPVSNSCGVVSRFGFSVYMTTAPSGSEGTWAVTAP
jgi:hypothetical protein